MVLARRTVDKEMAQKRSETAEKARTVRTLGLDICLGVGRMQIATFLGSPSDIPLSVQCRQSLDV